MVQSLEQRVGHVSVWIRRTICPIWAIIRIVPVEVRLPPEILHIMIVQTILIVVFDVDVRAHFRLEPVNVEGLFVQVFHEHFQVSRFWSSAHMVLLGKVPVEVVHCVLGLTLFVIFINFELEAGQIVLWNSLCVIRKVNRAWLGLFIVFVEFSEDI